LAALFFVAMASGGDTFENASMTSRKALRCGVGNAGMPQKFLLLVADAINPKQG
jgi:hypothetical protein